MVWLVFTFYRALLFVWMIGGIAFYGTIVNMITNIIRRVVFKLYIRICQSLNIKVGTIEDFMDDSSIESPTAPGLRDFMCRRATLVRSKKIRLGSSETEHSQLLPTVSDESEEPFIPLPRSSIETTL